MKTLSKLFFIMVFVGLVTGCTRSDDLEFDNATSSKKGVEKDLTMGFNLVFTGEYIYQGPDAECGDFPPYVRVINEGEGTGTHFGKVTSYFEFCVNANSEYPMGYEIAYFEDEDGDRLDVYVEGQVLGGRVPGMPSFANSYFKDPFTVLGGTGKFEGATGSGYTNDYNSENDPYSHHHWQGKITLIK